MDVLGSLTSVHGFFSVSRLSLDEEATTLTVAFVVSPPPSRHCRDGKAYGHTTTAIHNSEYTPPHTSFIHLSHGMFSFLAYPGL